MGHTVAAACLQLVYFKMVHYLWLFYGHAHQCFLVLSIILVLVSFGGIFVCFDIFDRMSKKATLLAQVFLSVYVVLLNWATFCVVLFCVIYVFCHLVVLVRLSVPVQLIDWKDSSLK